MIGIKITGATTTPEACADVLETAVSAGHTHGIGYWAQVESFERNDAKLPVLVLTDHQMDETGLHGLDVEKPSRFTLTVVEVADAINKMLMDPKGTGAEDWQERLLDSNHVDGPLADVIVQVACHGKVLYG